MKRILKKAVAMALAVCMLLAMTPEAYAASTIQISASKLSSSYKGSIFYTRANEAYNKYKNASDAERFVRVALSQKGYKGTCTFKGRNDKVSPAQPLRQSRTDKKSNEQKPEKYSSHFNSKKRDILSFPSRKKP